jgi:prevent-host-death family protein
MRTSEPKTQTLTIADVENTFSSLVHWISRQETRIVVEESGTPVAAIISVDDLERFVQLEREREERFAVIDRLRAAFADVSVQEIEREAERSVAEARERLRQRAR